MNIFGILTICLPLELDMPYRLSNFKKFPKGVLYLLYVEKMTEMPLFSVVTFYVPFHILLIDSITTVRSG